MLVKVKVKQKLNVQDVAQAQRIQHYMDNTPALPGELVERIYKAYHADPQGINNMLAQVTKNPMSIVSHLGRIKSLIQG